MTPYDSSPFFLAQELLKVQDSLLKLGEELSQIDDKRTTLYEQYNICVAEQKNLAYRLQQELHITEDTPFEAFYGKPEALRFRYQLLRMQQEKQTIAINLQNLEDYYQGLLELNQKLEEVRQKEEVLFESKTLEIATPQPVKKETKPVSTSRFHLQLIDEIEKLTPPEMPVETPKQQPNDFSTFLQEQQDFNQWNRYLIEQKMKHL